VAVVNVRYLGVAKKKLKETENQQVKLFSCAQNRKHTGETKKTALSLAF
jgi:hypothetical protein